MECCQRSLAFGGGFGPEGTLSWIDPEYLAVGVENEQDAVEFFSHGDDIVQRSGIWREIERAVLETRRSEIEVDGEDRTIGIRENDAIFERGDPAPLERVL